MGPNRDGSKQQQVKNESEGSGDIALSAGGKERVSVWEARHYGWVLSTGLKSTGLWQM